MKKIVKVTQYIEVEVDEAKFDEDFLKEFKENFYEFDNINEHIEHLARLYAKGMVGGTPNSFIEGYGEQRDMSISFKEYKDIDTEIEEIE